MSRAWVCILLAAACAPAPRNHDLPRGAYELRPAQGPFATQRSIPTAEPLETDLSAERDVLLLGEVPQVFVFTERGGSGKYHSTEEFDVRQPDGTGVARNCDPTRKPAGSRGIAVLDFQCKPLTQPGVHDLFLDPAKLGLPGRPLLLPFRVLREPPILPPAPRGWHAVSLVSGLPSHDCRGTGPSYEVRADSGNVTFESVRRGDAKTAPLPVTLSGRISPDHARGVRYVFEADDGWLVLSDHGEFGGGLEWFARDGGPPRSIAIGKGGADDWVPQNVNRAMVVSGAIYVLQGISHLGTSRGQLAKVWREHGHFTSHVVARYSSEPFDWIRESDGSWLVATRNDIWKTSEAGQTLRVARLPDVLWYPNSLARTDDGTFYVGTRSGVLRLTPTWPEAPRYASAFLMPRELYEKGCADEPDQG